MYGYAYQLKVGPVAGAPDGLAHAGHQLWLRDSRNRASDQHRIYMAGAAAVGAKISRDGNHSDAQSAAESFQAEDASPCDPRQAARQDAGISHGKTDCAARHT